MNGRSLPTVGFTGFAVAVLLIVWPLRSEQALWSVTVGHQPTKVRPVRGNQHFTPLRMLFEGVPPEAASLRSALRARVARAFIAAALGSSAFIIEGRRGQTRLD